VGDKLSENLADFAGVDNITNESDRNFGHLVQLEDHHNDAKKASENLNKLEEDHGDAAKRILWIVPENIWN
jgi:DNA-directed RNA polymerase subunit F